MADDRIYNPLDKAHLAESIVREFFKRKLHPLPPGESFTGAGIYALYYGGDFPLYQEISNSLKQFLACATLSLPKQPIPIYIGKSDPPGGRKGIFEELPEKQEETAEEVLTTMPKHRRLWERLTQHAKSIELATNLRISDFQCRYMLVDEVWVALGEARLVAWFRPLWNVLIEGFGSKVEGVGRAGTALSVWDILHPGRKRFPILVAPDLEAQILAALRDARNPAELLAAVKVHRDARRKFRKQRKPR